VLALAGHSAKTVQVAKHNAEASVQQNQRDAQASL